MTKNSELRAALIISGFLCDPDAVTDALGVAPSEVHRRGEEHGRVRRVVSENIWRLESKVNDSIELQPHVTWLLQQLPKDLSVLSRVTERWEVQLAVATHVFGSTGPSLALDGESISRLASMGASLDIDTYCRD